MPAGNQLSQHSKLDSHGNCNTQNGGVLIGEHPVEPGKIVNRKICFRSDCHTFEASKDLRDIRVINCNHFYLYELETVINANAKERYCTEMNMKNVDIQKMLQNNLKDLQQKSEEFTKNMNTELNRTRVELEQKSIENIQYLETKMMEKDARIMNEIQRNQKHPDLTMDEIPQRCKYMAYKNLTDETRKNNFFNKSGSFCDLDGTSEFGCTKSYDWKGRGLYL